MKTSREQFEEWFWKFVRTEGNDSLSLHDAMHETWQASRQRIEVDNRDIVTITCEHGGDVLLRDITSIKIVQYKGA